MPVDLKTGKTKIVEYLGNLYEVPMWANFIAADLDGDLWAYENRPVWVRVEYWPGRGGSSVYFAKTQPSQPPCLSV
jgi:hypothetical protein